MLSVLYRTLLHEWLISLLSFSLVELERFPFSQMTPETYSVVLRLLLVHIENYDINQAIFGGMEDTVKKSNGALEIGTSYVF